MVQVAYIVGGLSVACLLLSLVVWIDAQRTKRQAWRVLEWHQQQLRTVEQGGMVISVEVNPQARQAGLHLLTTQVVRARCDPHRLGSPHLN